MEHAHTVVLRCKQFAKRHHSSTGFCRTYLLATIPIQLSVIVPVCCKIRQLEYWQLTTATANLIILCAIWQENIHCVTPGPMLDA